MLRTNNILKWVSIKNGRNSCKMLNFSTFLGVNISILVAHFKLYCFLKSL